ncbi:MAG TPA: histidinol-phosphate transaminase [Dehalococcoidia bacterium]|nr:histidinol-phosphate transaminase [Dehalococcoidia bacterium]
MATARSESGNGGVLGLVRPEILSLPGYVAIEPPRVLAQRLGIPLETVAKLDANENPYGPAPKALAALDRFRDYHIYPDPDERELRQALARHLNLPVECIVASAGSDELIQIFASMFLGPGDNAIDLIPTFGMYAFEADVAGGGTLPVQRRADFSVDVGAVAERLDARTKLIFVTSPNNPTGNLLSREELEGLLGFGLPVMVDEAYIEFAGVPSAAPRVLEQPNLIVLRTFSKWAGLAGLRVGYAAMAAELAEVAFRIRQPYSVNVAAEVAAVASLEDAAVLDERAALVVQERERLNALLAGVPFLRPHPSHTNFILCDVLRGDARQLRDRLREHGVFIRHFDTPLLRDCIRISVGLPRHTEQLIEALQNVAAALGLA